VRKVFCVNRPAAHWVHRVAGARSCFHPQSLRLLSTHRSLDVYYNLELILPRARLLRVPSSRLLARSHLSVRALPAWVFRPLRDFTRAQPLFAWGPNPTLRSVLRFSQPLDGFLRARTCGPISSRCHVQDLTRSGASLPAQPPSLVGRSMPPGRWTRRNSPACAGCRHARPSTSRPSSARGRVRRKAVIHHFACRSPPRVRLLQALASRRGSQLTQVPPLATFLRNTCACALVSRPRPQRLARVSLGEYVSVPPARSSFRAYLPILRSPRLRSRTERLRG